MSTPFSILIRGDSTLKTISGDNVTIFELEKNNNIVIGLILRRLDEHRTITIETPLKVEVSEPINKSGFYGLKSLGTIEICYGNGSFAFLPLDGKPTLLQSNGGKISFVNNSKEKQDTHNYQLLPHNQQDIDLSDLLAYEDEILTYDSIQKTLIPTKVEISKIREARLYYKVTFHLITDITHIIGDRIFILISNRILFEKWFKN